VTSRTLGSAVRVRQHFVRSANVERDDLAQAVANYIPTGRSIDVLSRVARAMEHPSTGRAISITGPYGSGKSSLALFTEALLGPGTDLTTQGARASLREHAPSLARDLATGLTAIGAGDQGFIRAVITAKAEPIASTLARALDRGISERASVAPRSREARELRSLRRELEHPRRVQNIGALVGRVSQIAPVLLLIDEFGKNLEHFARDQSDARGDLYVLQELAEQASRPSGIPVLLLTLQHLAFDEYVEGVGDHRRREFAKIQGRFQDVPFVETPAEAQRLIASAFVRPSASRGLIQTWSDSLAAQVSSAGLEPALYVSLADCFPLHPVSVAVLPELCSRFGQNERTLFSFLAGAEPGAVPTLLSKLERPSDGTPPSCIGVADVYDYFVEAASSAIASSPMYSRWLEVESRVRDATGLTDPERELLKTIGLLNLVSAGGTIRASRQVLVLCAFASANGMSSEKDVHTVLQRLEDKGLITYREFADEFRVWHGTDFDLRGALETARKRAEHASLAELLQDVRPLASVVAGRHSQQTGTLRAFERRYIDRHSPPISTVQSASSAGTDGVVFLSLEPVGWEPEINPEATLVRPTVLGTSTNVDALAQIAREHAAHALALQSAIEREDWVAERELRERLAGTSVELDHTMHLAFSPAAAGTRWTLLGERADITNAQSLSAILSDLCDEVYTDCPPIYNEMLSRASLSSQGARARTDLLEAMTDAAAEPILGLEGYGPERAMYEATLNKPGIHRVRDGAFGFGPPKRNSRYVPVWREINKLLDSSASEPLTVDALHHHLAAPPIGLKEGPIPVLVVAALLARAEEVGVYEEGTFVGYLNSDVVDRLVKNPDRFSVRNFALRGARAEVVAKLADELHVNHRERPQQRVGTVIGVISPLLRAMRNLPPYSLRTRSVSAQTIEVRSTLLSAREPDQLLFTALPRALGFQPIVADHQLRSEVIEAYAHALQTAVRELEEAYPTLLDTLEASLAQQFGARADSVRDDLRVRADRLREQLIDPTLKAIANALTTRDASREAWLEQLGMVVARTAPTSWTDDDRASALQAVTHFGLAFRRVESLHYTQTQIEGAPFDAVRVAVTLPDGTDSATVVWADHHVQHELAELLSSTIELSTQRLGGKGPEMLLGALAQALLIDQKADQAGPGTDNAEREAAHG